MTSPFEPQSSQWLQALSEAGRSAGTLDCYARDLRDVASALGYSETTYLTSITQEMIDTMTEGWTKSGASSPTVARRFSAFREFARFLVRTVGLDCSRILAAKYPPAERVRVQTLQSDEYTTIVRVSEDGDWTTLCDTAVFALQAGAGLAAVEVVALERRSFRGSLINVTTTPFEPRAVGLSKETEFAVIRYLASVPFPLAVDGPLFVNTLGRRLSVRSVQLRFRQRRRGAGLSEDHGPSSLRRYMGTELALTGQSPLTLAKVLGLHQVSTLRYYGGME